MKSKTLLAFLCLFLQSSFAIAGWNIQSDKTYYLRCEYTQGFIGLSSEQGQTGYVLYQQTSGVAPTPDAYWQIIPYSNGYAFKNSYSGQYLSWTDDHAMLRNLDLVDDLLNDDQCWELVSNGNGLNIRSVSQPDYYFNLRINGTYTNFVALYDEVGSNNGIFHIYDENGEEIVYTDDGDVTAPPVENIWIYTDSNVNNLQLGVNVYLNVSWTPGDAEYPMLTWTSDNADFPVTQDGVVTVNGYGTATITATVQDNSSISASITLAAVDYSTIEPIWDSSKRYNIKNANGYGYMVYDPAFGETHPSLQGYDENASGLNECGNELFKEEADLANANTQWTIIRDDYGYYYLYNIGRRAYISNLSTGGAFQFVPDAYPFEVTDLGNGKYAFRMASFSDSYNQYMCAASQESNPITHWRVYDLGSEWIVSEATETNFDKPSDGVTVNGYNSGASWDGVGDTYLFPNWISNNTGISNSSSSYSIQFTVQKTYRISFDWSATAKDNTSTFAVTLDGEHIISPQSVTASGNYSQEHMLTAGTHELKFIYTNGQLNDILPTDRATVRNLMLTRVPKVESITLQASKTDVQPGDVVQIQATVLPEDAVNPALSWSTNNGDFSVTQDGVVTVKDFGTATITATSQDGSNVSASITLTSADVYMPYGENMFYLRHRDSTVTVLPRDLVESHSYSGSLFTATLKNQEIVQLKGIVDVSSTTPADLPAFLTYKFNNKFNPQVFTDVETTTPQAKVINLDVAGIGKWLTASFKLADPATEVYVGAVRQRSKYTRQSFAQPVVYRFRNPKWNIIRLRQQDGGTTYVQETSPYENKQTVNVRFLTDYSTNEYTVPRIDITLTDNPGRWGYNNWIGMNGTKRTYVNATIGIRGGGVFPDMEPTAIQIKGRGNSSWYGVPDSKNPYHFKFSVKQKPLGMTAGKHWILLANKQSGSMTTNAMGMKAAALFETAGYNHIVPVELYINGSYRGSYNLTERVGFSNNSIDLLDESCAAMMELDTYGDEPIYTSNAYGISTKIHIPDADDIAETNLTNGLIVEDYNRMVATLAQGDEEYTKLVDAEYLARYLSACELIWNRELAHPKSAFLYSENVTDDPDADGRDATPWIFGPLWDCDWAFGYEGSSQYYVNSAESDFFQSVEQNAGFSGRTFWSDLRYNSEEVDRIYYQLWHDLKQRNVVQELYDYAQEYYDFAKKSFEHNMQNECNERDGQNYVTVTQNSQNWLTTRFEHIFNSLTPYELPEEPDDPNAPGRDVMGDVNADGLISTADIVTLLNVLLNQPNETYYAGRADIDSNGEVSIADVVMLCSLVLEQTSSVRRQLRLPSATMHMYATATVLPTHGEGIVQLMVEADEGEYSALQMDIQLPEGVELDGVVLPAALNGMTARTRLMDNGKYRLVLYADGSIVLPTTAVAIGLRLVTGEATEGRMQISAVTASTSLGEEERLPACSARIIVQDTTTGVQLHKTTGEDAKLYDLSGRRQHQPTKGVYIRDGKKYIR